MMKHFNGRLYQPDFETVFRGKGMVRAELMDLFRICDLNNDGVIDEKEQGLFQAWFLEPFAKCDKNGDWHITMNEAKMCQASQSWFTTLATANIGAVLKGMAPHEGQSSPVPAGLDLMAAADRDKDGMINFAEQIFTRKTAAAWKKCVTGYGMNQEELRCALSITGNSPKINDGDARRVTLLALRWMQMGTKRLGFMVFVHIAQQYNTFVKMCFPQHDCHLTQDTVKKHIELQTVPNSLTPLRADFVSVYFDQFSHKSVGFPDFMIMSFWIDKQLQQAGKDREMDQLEFLTLLNDRTISFQLRDTIDNITTPIPEEDKKAAIVQVIGPALSNGGAMASGASSRQVASVVKDETPIDEMTFFGKNSLFVQKRSNLRKKQLFNYEKITADETRSSRNSIPRSAFFPGNSRFAVQPEEQPIGAKTLPPTNQGTGQKKNTAQAPNQGSATPDMTDDDILGDMHQEDINETKAETKDTADATAMLESGKETPNKPGNNSDVITMETKAPAVTMEQASSKPQRIIVFNIVDTDMNGSLSMSEFFIFLRQNVVFSVLAGQDTNLQQFDITKSLYQRNKDELSTQINNFPTPREERAMKMLERQLMDGEVNLKEFLIMALGGYTFSKLATLEPGMVSLADIMINAKRWDMFVCPPKSFITILTQGNMPVAGKLPTYNSGIAMMVMLRLEMAAVKLTKQAQHKEAYGLEMADYEKAEKEYANSN